MPLTVEQLHQKRDRAMEDIRARSGKVKDVMVCCGTGCVAGGAFRLKEALEKEVEQRGLGKEVRVVATGCNGFCGQGPLAVVMPDGTFYGWLKPEDAPKLVEEHLVKGQPVKKFMFVSPDTKETIPHSADIPFFQKQMAVVLRNKGLIDPESIDEYIAREGYQGLEQTLTTLTPEEVIEQVTRSGLRGRGGAGFPTGIKWKVCRGEKKTPKSLSGNN